MIIAKRLKGKAIATWLGPTGDAARRALSKAREKLTNAPRRLDLYFEIGDPWSYVAAQAVQRLLAVYPVELGFHVVTPPASDVAPVPEMRTKHAVRDAQLLAEYWDVVFPGKKEPDAGLVKDVGTVLIKQRPATEQLAAAIELANAMWTGDKKQLASLLLKYGTDSANSIAPILNSNYRELRKAGHYQGAMIHYGDTWYWGLDRLPYLEVALAEATGREPAHVVRPRPEAERGPLKLSDRPLVCEMWFSFRSPYSYLGLEQIEAVLAPFGVPLVAKPVPPMVNRGLPVPQIKQLYIVRDAKREANRLGIPFGELCDPLGKGVDHCLAIAHWAQARAPEALLAFAHSAMRGIWSEARDLGAYVDLRQIVERANLPWNEARAAIDDPAGAKAAAANAAEMAVYGMWGVPSFRCGDFIAWGQDRLPLLADRLRRHMLADSQPGAAQQPG